MIRAFTVVMASLTAIGAHAANYSPVHSHPVSDCEFSDSRTDGCHFANPFVTGDKGLGQLPLAFGGAHVGTYIAGAYTTGSDSDQHIVIVGDTWCRLALDPKVTRFV
jgi:hypothetical protein